MRRRRSTPSYALPVLTTFFERHGFKPSGFSPDDGGLTGVEEHYFVRDDCTYAVAFGLGQHTSGDLFVALGASHPAGPGKTKFAPLSYFTDYYTTLNRLLAAGMSRDEALAQSVEPHIEYSVRVALLAHSRGRSIPLRADLQDAQTESGRVEP